MPQTFVLCPCQGVDAADLPPDTLAQIAPRAFCGADADAAAAMVEDAILCCSQDPALFERLAQDLNRPAPPVIDLRPRMGAGPSTAKLTALLAEAVLPASGAKTVDVLSEGVCLILGLPDDIAPVARQLKPYLSVTCLIPNDTDLDDPRGFDVVKGTLRHAKGALGQFEVRIDALQQRITGGQHDGWTVPQDGATTTCDIILDLRGAAPLFPAPEKREGYLRADPRHPPSVAAATLTASHLVGTFEKPLYVRVEPQLCAHSRAGQTGCTRCLDLCPTSAIMPAGDHVAVDPMVCAGCGACSSACPSGAIEYDAPPVAETMHRVQALAQALRAGGMAAPRLLVHDAHGADMIRLAARSGADLPRDVLPMEMAAINAFGHAEILAAAAAGFAEIAVLPGPGADIDALDAQIDIARALAGTVAVRRLDVTDPDALPDAFAGPVSAPTHIPARPMGTRRQITRQAARALNDGTDARLPLPHGAPYGAVTVDTDACTLCLSCVSLCPSGALGDNPDKPQLRFQEDACLQCGICVEICPETALRLDPGMDLSDAALRQRVLHEEEPFACISCGTPFGSKATIDRITEKLTGHAMFTDPAKLKMIQMCDDCRVVAQVHSTDNPFQSHDRPRPRTTDDYLSKRSDH